MTSRRYERLLIFRKSISTSKNLLRPPPNARLDSPTNHKNKHHLDPFQRSSIVLLGHHLDPVDHLTHTFLSNTTLPPTPPGVPAKMGASASKPDPFGLYAHAIAPPLLPTSMVQAEGPTVILVWFICFLSGANLSLFAVYYHLFGGFGSRKHRDSFLLQSAVFLSVLCNVVLALVGFICVYRRSLIDLYSKIGFDTNAIEWYVPLYHTMQAIPEAIGQLYFVIRIAKLFDVRKLSTRIAVGVATVGIFTQFVLMIWFGAAFYAVRYKHRLLDPTTRHWVKGIISAWAIIFVLLEISMTLTTMARLIVLRRQTSMDAARRILFNLGVYSLQGQIVLTTFSLTSFYLFSSSVTGWYTPMYLLSGALYTLVLLANLIYRRVISTAMQKATSDYSPSTNPEQRAQRNFNFNAVCTYRTETSHDIRLEPSKLEISYDGRGRDRRETGCSTMFEAGHNRAFSESAAGIGGDERRFLRSDPGLTAGRSFANREKRSRANAPAPLVTVTRTTSVQSLGEADCIAVGVE